MKRAKCGTVDRLVVEVDDFFGFGLLFGLNLLDLFGGALEDVYAFAGDFFPGSGFSFFVGGESLFGGFVGVCGGDGFDVGGGDDFFDAESAGGAVGEGVFGEGLDDGESAGADFAGFIEFFVFVGWHLML